MTKFDQTVTADLDPEWVSDILITAFDGQYGGCWYWVNEEDGITQVLVRHAPGNDGMPWTAVWFAVDPEATGWRPEVLRNTCTAVVDKPALDWAWGEVLSKYGHTATARQLRDAMTSMDLDVDAEGADVLVQVALFGEIVYG